MSPRTFERRVDAGSVKVNPHEGMSLDLVTDRSPYAGKLWSSNGQDLGCENEIEVSWHSPLTHGARNQACIGKNKQVCSGESAL
jgi:hypothetical protein